MTKLGLSISRRRWLTWRVVFSRSTSPLSLRPFRRRGATASGTIIGGLVLSLALGACTTVESADTKKAKAAASDRAAKDQRRWEADTKLGIYLKVPKSWKRFRVDPYRVATDRIDPPRRRSGWSVVLDSAKRPSDRHAQQVAPLAPVIEMSYFDLPSDWKRENTEGRDGLSLAVLRSIGSESEGDPIAAWNGGDPTIEVLQYGDQFHDNGTWGVRIRVNRRYDEGEFAEDDKWTTVDSWVFIDRVWSRAYIVRAKCESSCFRKNKATIDQIMDSFRLKGVVASEEEYFNAITPDGAKEQNDKNEKKREQQRKAKAKAQADAQSDQTADTEAFDTIAVDDSDTIPIETLPPDTEAIDTEAATIDFDTAPSIDEATVDTEALPEDTQQ